MSCYYKTLPRLIPQLLLLARPKSEIILVSPWIEDVTLYPSCFGQGQSYYDQPKIYLSQLLLRLARDYGMLITLVIREQDYRSAKVIRPLVNDQPDHLIVKEVPYLHAKLVITESFILQTSANLLWTSLYRNIESCTLKPNLFHNSRLCLKTELGLSIT